MLTTGLSVVEQIFVCDEGVMGFHNDRRAGGKMPANDSWEVISTNIFTVNLKFHYFLNLRKMN